MAEAGHNRVEGEQLKSFVERIESLEEERKELGVSIEEVYGEAKFAGYDKLVIRDVVKLRRMKDGERNDRLAMLDLYLGALGDLAGTPLGQAAMERASA